MIWECLHDKLLWHQNSVFLFCLTYYKKQTHEWDKNLYRLNGKLISIILNKVLFPFQTNPLRRSVSYVISEKKKLKIRNFFKDTSTHVGVTLVIMKKQKTLQLFLTVKNTGTKQTIKEED